MSAFVFTLTVKPPVQSSVYHGRKSVLVKSNVRLPDWVLNQLESVHESPFYGWLPSGSTIKIQRVRHNYVIAIHLHEGLWHVAGDKILEVLAFAPSNSRVNFPVRIVHKGLITGKTVKIVEYPIL